MNHWDIPDWLEREVKERDRTCIYCGTQMVNQMPPSGPRKAVATWEHIINDASIVTRENIARCCVPCNSSKGTKKLSDWIKSSYCKKRGINKDTVAEVVKEALRVHTEQGIVADRHSCISPMKQGKAIIGTSAARKVTRLLHAREADRRFSTRHSEVEQ